MTMQIDDLIDVSDAVARLNEKAFALWCAILGAERNPHEEHESLEWLADEVLNDLRKLKDGVNRKLAAERVAAE